MTELKYRHRETKEELQSATPSTDSKHIHLTHADGSESKMSSAEFAQTHEKVPAPLAEAEAQLDPIADLHTKLDKVLAHLAPTIDTSPDKSSEPAS